MCDSKRLKMPHFFAEWSLTESGDKSDLEGQQEKCFANFMVFVALEWCEVQVNLEVYKNNSFWVRV